MAFEQKHHLADLYQLYEERSPPRVSSAVQKVDLKLDRNLLINFVTGDIYKIATDYDTIHKGDAKNTKGNARWLDWESRELHHAFFSLNQSIAFSVKKSFARMHDDVIDDAGTYPPHSAGEERESIFFELHDGTKEIGGYRLDRGMNQTADNEWALNDRWVLDEYREQGIGAVLMTATESFVQSMADFRATPQKLTANVAQPSVLLMFLNKGFVARDEADQRLIDMVLCADPSLELDYAVVKRDNGKWEPQQYKDPYVFQKGTELKSEVNAFRINLEKTFVPKTNPVDTHTAVTKSSIQKISGSAVGRNPDYETKTLVANIETIKNLEGLRLPEKIELILLLLGEKRHISFFLMVEDSQPLEIENIRDALLKIGLACEVKIKSPSLKNTNTNYRQFNVAANTDDLHQFVTAENDETMGILSGFPPTAVDAFVRAKQGEPVRLLNIDDLPEDVQTTEYAAFCSFVFSENWRQELEVPKRWSDLIKKYAPELHEKLLQSWTTRQKPQIVKFEE